MGGCGQLPPCPQPIRLPRSSYAHAPWLIGLEGKGAGGIAPNRARAFLTSSSIALFALLALLGHFPPKVICPSVQSIGLERGFDTLRSVQNGQIKNDETPSLERGSDTWTHRNGGEVSRVRCFGLYLSLGVVPYCARHFSTHSRLTA